MKNTLGGCLAHCPAEARRAQYIGELPAVTGGQDTHTHTHIQDTLQLYKSVQVLMKNHR